MNSRPTTAREITDAQSVLVAAARVTRQATRLSLLAVLTLLEPVVRTVFSLAMVLGIVAAVVFELSAVGPSFPSVRMLSVLLGFGLALIAYYGLLSVVSR